MKWVPRIVSAVAPEHLALGAKVVTVVAAAGLLLAFQHVLEGAVRQGELRRAAVADHAQSVWRCNMLHIEAVRQECLSKLREPSRAAL